MSQEFLQFFFQASILLPTFLVSLTIHEWCHAWAATVCGDNTPRRMGRLSLNPLVHIDPLGLFFLLVFHLGWARPVVFDYRNFVYPRLYTVITALIGPFSNICLALMSLYILQYFPYNVVSPAVALTVQQIMKVMVDINIMLGVFNLLPIPPLDGSHIFSVFMVDYSPQLVVWLYRYGIFFLLGLFIVPQTRMMLITMMMITKKALQFLVI